MPRLPFHASRCPSTLLYTPPRFHKLLYSPLGPSSTPVSFPQTFIHSCGLQQLYTPRAFYTSTYPVFSTHQTPHLYLTSAPTYSPPTHAVPTAQTLPLDLTLPFPHTRPIQRHLSTSFAPLHSALPQWCSRHHLDPSLKASVGRGGFVASRSPGRRDWRSVPAQQRYDSSEFILLHRVPGRSKGLCVNTFEN